MVWAAWDPHGFVPCLLVSGVLQLVGWLISRKCKVRVLKVMFPVAYVAIATVSLLTYIVGGANHPRKTLITFLTAAYGFRLGGFLVFRTLSARGRERIDDAKFPVTLVIMLAFIPLLLGLPVIFCNSPLAPEGSVGLLETVGTTVLVFGLLFETVADYQKFTFRQNPRNEGKWCDVGLYKYSRYPNYFGDLCVWWGIFLLSVPTLGGLRWAAVLSPLLESCVILKWDGVPKLEIEHEKRYGNNPEYVEYKRTTSTIVPCPPWLYRIN